MTQHAGIIFNFDDINDFYTVVAFLERQHGIKIIYKTIRKDDRLYITSESEMKGRG